MSKPKEIELHDTGLTRYYSTMTKAIPPDPISPDSTLRRAAWHLMRQTCIWYDKVEDGYGNLVPGPENEAVVILCKLASEIRVAAILAGAA